MTYYDDNSDVSSDCSSYYVGNKKSSNGKRKIKRVDAEGNIKSVDIYPTKNVSGGPIRNSVTGHVYKDQDMKNTYVVGSKFEALYFKVKMATGDRNTDNVLFYDGPSEFEAHHGFVLDDKIKEDWKEKTMALRLDMLAKEYEFR